MLMIADLDCLCSFDEIIESSDEGKPWQSLELIEQILLLHLKKFPKKFCMKCEEIYIYNLLPVYCSGWFQKLPTYILQT